MSHDDATSLRFAMVSHALVHTYELAIPLLVVVWLTEFGLTTALLGAIVAVGYGLFGFGALPAGLLVDAKGSARLMVGGLVGMAAAFLLLSRADGALHIGAALAIWGIAASIHHPAALALISTRTTDRGRAFALHGMAGNVGIALGPLVLVLLLVGLSWRGATAVLAAGGILAAGWAASRGLLRGVVTTPVSASDLRRIPEVFTVGFSLAMVVVLMNGLFYRGSLTFLPGLLGDLLALDASAIPPLLSGRLDVAALVYVGLLAVGIGGQYLGGYATDRIPPERGLMAVFAVLALLAVVFVPVAALGTVPLIGIAAGFGLTLFALQPLYQATIARHSPPDRRGLSYGLTYLFSFGIGATGAAIAGWSLGLIGPTGTFVLLALFPVVGVACAVILQREAAYGQN